MQKKKLVWNVYIEDFNGKDINVVNILSYSIIKEKLAKLRKEFKQGTKQYALTGSYIFKDYGGDIVFDVAKMKKSTFEDKFFTDVFCKQLRSTLMYYFWSRCEYEIVLTSWPPYITADEFKAIKQSEKDVKYRDNINLEVAKKIDVYDQIINNWEPFTEYVWKHLFEADLK